jgi:hypothetical protein
VAQLLAIDLPSREFELQFEKTLTRLAVLGGEGRLSRVLPTALSATRHNILGGGGQRGGGYRLSAYASIPCYLCVAVALTVSKVLT